MDWGEPGLRCTLTALDGAGVRYAGAGLTAAEADAACFVDVAGCTLALAEDALDRREHFGKIVVHVTGQPA